MVSLTGGSLSILSADRGEGAVSHPWIFLSQVNLQLQTKLLSKKIILSLFYHFLTLNDNGRDDEHCVVFINLFTVSS